MEQRFLGKSGLSVSTLSFGTMTVGGKDRFQSMGSLGVQETSRMIDICLDAGVNLIDTADLYSFGAAEEVLAGALKGRRQKVLIATKGFMRMGPGAHDVGLSRKHLIDACEASLRRLGTDYIDVYQVHNWDWTSPVGETMAALDQLVRDGKVRYIGCSNWQASQIVEGQWAAERIGGAKLVSLQPQYSLAVRDIERDILPTARRHGLGVIVWSPLAGGLLTGKYSPDGTPPSDARYGRGDADVWERFKRTLFTDRNFAIVDSLGEAAKSLGTNHAAVAVAWTLAQRGVTSAIIGPRTVEQLEDNLAAGELELPAGTAKELDRASRGAWAYPNYMQPEPA